MASWQNLVLSLLLRLRMKPLSKHGLDVEKARALAAKPLVKPKVPAGFRLRTTTDAPLKGDWIEPVAAGTRTLLYLHGGGYFFCSPETHRPVTLGLAQAADARVFAPDYRLAPEHRYPAALEDALASYRKLLANGIPPARIVFAGDSAGGGLALATLLRLRDAGEPMPAGAVLFSPWTDLAATGATLQSNNKRDVMFYGDGIAKGGRIYLGDTPATDPYASPLYADLAGLPPLFVQASDSEVLLDDSARLAAKARAAGVPVEFKAWSRVPHAFQLFAPFLPEARAALAETGAFIKRMAP